MKLEEGPGPAGDSHSVSNIDGQEGAAAGDKMGFSKPKSAPGSVAGEKPKWITSKGNTLKEIESWATEGHENDAPDYARHSGQLMDNVTEQRMLQSKLWELSKERHKFLTQNSYEKKIFLDRQQRKSGAMREMLDGVTPDGRRTGWGDEAMRRRANIEDETAGSARSVFLDRVDPKKRRDRPKEGRDWESRHSSCPTPSESGRRTMLSLPQVAPSIVASHDGHLPAKNPRVKAAVGSSVFPTEPKVSKKATDQKRPKSSYDRMLSSQLQPADHPPTTVRFAESRGGTGSNHRVDESLSSSNPDPRRPPSRSWSTIKWNRSTSMSARSRLTEREADGPAADRRYLLLRQALAENYYNQSRAGNITQIIGSVEALHRPTKRSKDSQPRVTHRIKEFMRQRGLQF